MSTKQRRFRIAGTNPFTELKEFFSGKTVLIFLGSFFGAVLLISLYLFYLSSELPSLDQLEEYKPKLSSKVYSSDMKIIDEYFEKKRSYVALEEMPEDLINAAIAIEDRDFFNHWGINIKRFLKAAFINATTMSYAEGASTLTQQLARQLYLTLEKSVTRKLKEWITAVQIERTYTKEEILEMYLNHMYFGNGANGAQNAARNYFNKEVQELEVDECAMLIAILKAPAIYSPITHPDRALRRRNLVLAAMRDLGFITSPEFLANISKPVKVYKYASSQAYGDAPYFTEYVRRQLEERFGQDLYTEGLTIYTTLDSRAQAVAERAVREHLPVIQEAVRDYHVNEGKLRALLDEGFIRKHKYETLARDSVFVDSLINAKAAAQVALVSLDPGTGHILAWIGGRDFGESKFDRVYQGNGRQPGSAFKPFVYTVAIDNGWKTTDEELNQPVVVNMPDGSRWNPQNYDHSVGGATTFRVALQRSLNLVTVRVLQGKIQNPQLVVDYAHKMGIKTELQPVDALALGASDVKPIDLTSAFGVFANGGILVDPISILRVEDKHGNILWQHQPNRQEVLRKETAYIMTSMLQSVLATEDSVTGTGVGARWRYNFLRPAGGKTGTTNDYSDAWFVGFTPQIVTGVWIGIDDYTISLGNGQTGSRAAMPIWAPYMKAVHDTLALPILDFEMPIGVVRREVCMVTKDLANDVCPRIKEEVFFEGNSPTEHCRVHVGLTNGLRERESQGRKRVRF